MLAIAIGLTAHLNTWYSLPQVTFYVSHIIKKNFRVVYVQFLPSGFNLQLPHFLFLYVS